MPRFLTRVYAHVSPPGITPEDVDELVPMPNRMLFELPRDLARLIANSGPVDVPDAPRTMEEHARAAAMSIIPADAGIDVDPVAFAHREVDGRYVAVGNDTYTFVLRPAAASPVASLLPAPRRHRHLERSKDEEVWSEFRCHVVVEPI